MLDRQPVATLLEDGRVSLKWSYDGRHLHAILYGGQLDIEEGPRVVKGEVIRGLVAALQWLYGEVRRVTCSSCDKVQFESPEWDTTPMQQRVVERTVCDACKGKKLGRIILSTQTNQPEAWGWHRRGRELAYALRDAFPGELVIRSISPSGFLDLEGWEFLGAEFQRQAAQEFVNVVIGFGGDFEKTWSARQIGGKWNIAVTGRIPRKPNRTEIEWLRRFDSIVLIEDGDWVGATVRAVRKALA